MCGIILASSVSSVELRGSTTLEIRFGPGDKTIPCDMEVVKLQAVEYALVPLAFVALTRQ
jgi:hypothetical protein